MHAATASHLRLAREYLAAHFREDVTLERLGELTGYSPCHFQRLYREAFGESPRDFVVRLRMQEAQRLLRGTGADVTDVCFEVGYASLGTFSSRFAQRFGCAPTEFRRIYAVPGLWVHRVAPACFLRRF